MDSATCYAQWESAAIMLDFLEGKDSWKKELASPDYDYELIQDRLLQFRNARESGDLNAMLFLLRTSLHRNLGDMV